MMQYIEYVVGFGVCDTTCHAAAAWNDKRRALHLCRPDVRMPLGVDPRCRTVAIDTKEANHSNEITITWMECDDHKDATARQHMLHPTFSSIQNVIAALSRGLSASSRAFAVSQCVPTGCRLLRTNSLQDVTLSDRVDELMSERWVRVGYDVCDHWMISALQNCAFSGSEMVKSNVDWSARINEWHLFSSVDTAVEFSFFSDVRVPEHAPFSVYGLYFIESALTCPSSAGGSTAGGTPDDLPHERWTHR